MGQPTGNPRGGGGETPNYDNPILKALGGIGGTGGIGNPIGANPINYAEQYTGGPAGYNNPVPTWNILGTVNPTQNVNQTATQPNPTSTPAEQSATSQPTQTYAAPSSGNSQFGPISPIGGVSSDSSSQPGVPITNTPIGNTTGIGTYGNFYGAPGTPGATPPAAANVLNTLANPNNAQTQVYTATGR